MMAKHGLDKQVVVIMPLLVGLDGHEKMSKSKGNYVGVTDESNDMFGKVMSIPDVLMGNYFELLTDLPRERIQSLVDPGRTHPRKAKDILGRIIVEAFHDRKTANGASEEFRRRFRDNELPADIETRPIPTSPIGAIQLVRQVGFASSNSEARRLIEQGAVTLDDSRIDDPTARITIDGSPVLKVGKRRVCRVCLEP